MRLIRPTPPTEAPIPAPPVAAEAHRPISAPTEPSTFEVTLAAFQGLAYALSARSLLLLSIVGAFALGLTALLKGGVLPLVALGIYSAFTVIPVAILEARKR